MARDIEADVKINDKTSAGLQSSARNVETMGKRIKAAAGIDATVEDKTRAGMQEALRTIQRAQKFLEEAAKTEAKVSNATEKGLREAERDIDRARAKIRDIEIDVEVRADVDRSLREVERKVKESNDRIKKQGTSDIERFSGGILGLFSNLFPQVTANIVQGFRAIAPALGGTLVAGVALALPAIGAMISGAVIGGGALAGIAGGVLIAVRDPRVKEAGEILKSSLLSSLGQDVGVFIGPLLAQISVVAARFQALRPVIRNIFAQSAGFLEPLTDGVITMVEYIAGGLNKALAGAGPAVEAIAEGLATVGRAIGYMFATLAADGENAGEGLLLLFDTLAVTIVTTTNALRVFSEIFGFLIDAASALGPIAGPAGIEADRLKASMDRAKDSSAALAGGFGQVAIEAKTTETATKLYEKALEDNARAAEQAADAHRNLFNDLTSVGEAQAAATKAARDNGKTLSANTEKGRANRQALSALASSLNGYRGNLEKSGASAGKVNGVLSTQRSRLIAAANSFGVTGSKARALADQLLGIKPREVSVKVNGTASAASQARNVRQEIAGIQSKTVTVSVNVNASRLASVENRLARLQRAGYNAGEGGPSFGLVEGGSGARTGGPVQVNSSVAVQLDGRPFREYTAKGIEVAQKRTEFRNRVGRRNG